MAGSTILYVVILSAFFAGLEVLAQQPYCYSFEAADSTYYLGNYGYYGFWKYSNKDKPTFSVPASEDGYMWTKYTTSTTINPNKYKPQIQLPVQRKISRSTSYSLKYYFNPAQFTNNITINFIRSSDNLKIRVGVVTANLKNVSTWLTYSGDCQLCCEVDVQTCAGQFEIYATNIDNLTDLAISSFSINNGSCASKQTTSCSEFDSWGNWVNVENWFLSKDGPLHPRLPPRDGSYAWVATAKPPTLNLTSPLIVDVTMSTKLSLDYFMTDSANTIIIYFWKGNNFSISPLKIAEFTGSVDNQWDHREIKCQLPSGSYCCGSNSDRCDGYFLFDVASVSSGIIAIDDVGVNNPDCGKNRTSHDLVIDDDGIINRGPGRGRFNVVRKDEHSFFSFNYIF